MYRPSVKFFCDIDYDPFLFMQDEKKVYGKVPIATPKHLLSLLQLGFTISLFEYIETIPTLWDAVKGDLHIYLSCALMLTGQTFRVHENAPRLNAERQCLGVRLG